jgi:hypothetical protein
MSADRDFERQMLLARLRGNLMNEAIHAVEAHRRDGVEPNFENLVTALTFAVAKANPRSSIVPWHLPDQIVLKMIHVVAGDVAVRRAA